MAHQDEVNIFRVVKIMPLFIILIAFFSIYILYKNNQIHLNKEVERLTEQVMNEKEQAMEGEVLSVYDFIKQQRSLTTERIEKNIRQKVYEAHTIASSIYNNNRDKNDAQLKKLIIDALRNIRFSDGRGYFFIYDRKGINMMHPILPDIENTNLWDFKDIKGKYVIRELSQLSMQQGAETLRWWWKKPSDPQTEYEKIGYVEHFSPFDWFIGTGDYVLDYEEQLKKELLVSINKIRYGKEGYIFVIDQMGDYLSHVKKQYIGTNRIDYKDANGVLITQEILNIARSGQGFFSYEGSVKPSTGKASQKRSFVIGIDDWQWAIGSGAYLDDIAEIVSERTIRLKEKNSKELVQNLIFAVVISLMLFVLSLFFTKVLKKHFSQYQKTVHEKNLSLYNLNLNLERLVLSRTTALATANSDLKSTLSDLESTQSKLVESEKMASMVGLVAGMAHELNTPLGIMVTSISQLETEIGAMFEKFTSQKLTRKDLQEVEKSWLMGHRLLNDNLQRSVHLVQSFKSLSTYTSDDDLQTFPIKFIVDSVIDTFVNQFKKVGVTLNIDVDKDLIITNYQWVLGEVLRQLINNSLTHGFTEIETPRIDINIQRHAEKIDIYYADNGIGSENIDKIFEPFYTTKRGSECTGLGLPIIYNQVTHKLSGSIMCEKNKQQGLGFYIQMPMNISTDVN